MEEIWKCVKGYEDYYQVSNFGRVRSLPRLVWNGSGMRMIKERILKDYISKTGYHYINLHRDGKMKHFLVHRLVYTAFNGEIPKEMQVNHISECKNDNALSNLNLMTPKENCNWGTKNERAHRKFRKKVLMDNEKEFCSLHEAARYLGCTEGTISKCCKNPKWTIYGHHFKYKEESNNENEKESRK